MKIENNKMVSLVYELRESNSEGRIIETLEENNPLRFVFGTGRLLPQFESNIDSLSEGDPFNFTLAPEFAYGEKSDDMIVNVPKSAFEIDGKLNEEICRVGNEVPMMDNEGNPLNGVINEITDTYVRMDFNHPMAGIELYFTGKIVGVREATFDEIEGVSSCSGCGSGGHSCSGGCN
jgi:FKBP-type peptidyl-prolyl cis-trans isomerase SlyD